MPKSYEREKRPRGKKLGWKEKWMDSKSLAMTETYQKFQIVEYMIWLAKPFKMIFRSGDIAVSFNFIFKEFGAEISHGGWVGSKRWPADSAIHLCLFHPKTHIKNIFITIKNILI